MVGKPLSDKLDNLKTGLKDLAGKFTAEDAEPRTDAMAGRRTGTRRPTHRTQTKEELYAEAQRLNIKGRSTMTKPQLTKAIQKAHRTHK